MNVICDCGKTLTEHELGVDLVSEYFECPECGKCYNVKSGWVGDDGEVKP